MRWPAANRESDVGRRALQYPGYFPRITGEPLPRFGQRHAAAAAVEQPGRKFLLQSRDAPAQRRLRDTQFDRRAREASGMGCMEEQGQIVGVHRAVSQAGLHRLPEEDITKVSASMAAHS
jgi:hypothetical protein